MTRAPGPVGFLIPEFPGQTHAFFWREIRAIEETGVPVTIFSTTKPSRESCPHAFAEAARSRTCYLFPPSLPRAGSVLLRHPGRMAAAIRYVLALHETPARRRAKLLGLILSAADLSARCAEQGISHVHIHSCANTAHLGALAHILSGLDYSLTLHGDLPVYGTDHRAKMARARFVSAVTRPLAAQLQALDSPCTRHPVIWMGVDTTRFAPAEHRAPAPALKAVTIARLNHAKGHRFFLRAMARCVAEGLDLRYSIAGDGPERAAIEAEISALGLQERVTLLGSVSESQVLALLQQSDVLALTSIGQGEAAPVTVMEAMSAGLPVICSRIGGTPDMIEDGVSGLLVDQEDVDGIADRLRRLSADPQLAQSIGQAARARAETLFDHRRNAQALLAEISRNG